MSNQGCVGQPAERPGVKHMDLTVEQWAIIEPLIPRELSRGNGKGRPRRNAREILNGILWILRTGAQWQDLPDRYPPYQTCHRRFQEWNRAELLPTILRALAEDLKNEAESTSKNALSMAPSRGPKRGLQSRKNQAGQGHEDHGNRRQRWSSCRHMH